MKLYVFGIGILLMLSFSLTGTTRTASMLLQRASNRSGPLTSLAIGVVSLILLIVALAWSVPPREGA
ncbi:hypothetical protein C9I57_17970 [Trinickia symbiotica]|uniref:Uncharacterized protein n=1 Tax=Trinickia symbiotica TaxID=863227 RepID=A0A2T3XSV9_9BURK|nr:hypothetical protein [Trinickia symbiotica]PTB19567.1 hypothetical protein C9I57_17970 [Trinickia symbiotica]